MEDRHPCEMCANVACRYQGKTSSEMQTAQRDERRAVVQIVNRLMWNNPHPFNEFDLLMRVHVVRAAVKGHRASEKWFDAHPEPAAPPH